MKKILFILIIASLGCSKEQFNYCYHCDIYTSNGITNQHDELDICGWTEEDAQAFEESGTSVIKTTSGTIIQETYCNRKP